MSKQLKYMPIIRGRQEEFKVLKTFNFGDHIYPCLEIIKEVFRKDRAPKEGTKPKKKRRFEDDYIPFIENINAKHVFVDLPIHLRTFREMKLDTLNFLQSVVVKREKRTEYFKKLSSLNPKVIPIISTYADITVEPESIKKQEKELRSDFDIIALRTFMKTFYNDMAQFEPLLKKTDYVIMDWDNEQLDLTDGDKNDIVEYLKNIKCTVIVHRNSFHNNIKNVNLKHGEIVEEIDNSILEKYKEFSGNCFSDYAGIKKDYVSDGGTISPGFVYYDSVNNEFYGYRYKYGGHKKGEKLPNLEEFETRIVPAVIDSAASKRMHKDPLDYLGAENIGWKILTNIRSKGESGKNAGKFKRIGMEHYLHCMKTKISNGDFD